MSNVQLYYVSSAVSLYFPYDFCLYPGMTALVSHSLRYIPFVLGLIISVILYSANRWMSVHAFRHLCSYLECDIDHTVYCRLVFSCVVSYMYSYMLLAMSYHHCGCITEYCYCSFMQVDISSIYRHIFILYLVTLGYTCYIHS